MTELERYKEALEKILDQSSRSFGQGYEHIFNIAHTALNPPQEFEEVEVVRWMCVECNHIYDRIPTTCPVCLGPPPKGVIKLTGTYRRPKPQKVKRREEITTMQPYDLNTLLNGKLRPNARVFQEWEEEI